MGKEEREAFQLHWTKDSIFFKITSINYLGFYAITQISSSQYK